MPASRWPGTVQKKVYVPGLRLTTVESSPSAMASVWPTVFAARVFEGDVVRDALPVGEVDGHFAGFGFGGVAREGEAAGGGFDLQRAAAAGFFFFGAAGAAAAFGGFGRWFGCRRF